MGNFVIPSCQEGSAEPISHWSACPEVYLTVAIPLLLSPVPGMLRLNLTRADLEKAIRDLNANVSHPFGDSTNMTFCLETPLCAEGRGGCRGIAGHRRLVWSI